MVKTTLLTLAGAAWGGTASVILKYFIPNSYESSHKKSHANSYYGLHVL